MWTVTSTHPIIENRRLRWVNPFIQKRDMQPELHLQLLVMSNY